MIDIVQRLRDQGRDAFAKHYSLGTFKLCDEAAAEIESLRSALSWLEEYEPGMVGDARGKFLTPLPAEQSNKHKAAD